MTRSSAEVEAEVEAQRGRIDRTVEALESKMTPSEIFDETAQALGGVGQQVLSRALEQAKQNPIPAVLVGVGLAWMMVGSGRSGASSSASGWRSGVGGTGLGDRVSDITDSVGQRGRHMASQVGDMAQQAQDKASGMVSDVRDKLSDVADQAREGLHSAKETLRSKTQSFTGTANETRRWASQRAGDLIDGEPLLLAGLGLAVGFAIGSALPSTDIEDQALGPVRDQLFEKGKEVAQHTLEQAGEVAQKAYGAAKDELTPDDQPRETV